MATKKKSNTGSSTRGKKKGGPVIEGSPITVGGGGGSLRPPRRVYIAFHRIEDYPDQTGGSNKKKLFQMENPLRSLMVWINRVPFDLKDLLTTDGECKIKIHAKGSSEDVDFFADKAGIKFHTGRYPPEAGNNHNSPDDTNFINKVRVKSPYGEFKRERLTAADEVVVRVDII